MKIQASTKILAVILAAATAPSIATAAPLPSLFHLHPSAPDSRVHFTVYNQAFRRYEVRIAGKRYEIQPHRALIIAAPAGTQIYAASDMHSAKNGALLHEVTPQDESHRIVLD